MKRWWRGVGYALNGILYAIRSEPNLRFHFLAAVVVLTLAAFFGFRRWEWSVLLLTCALVISLELVNTAIERAVDLTTERVHPLAKLAKDIAAGAVLTSSLFSLAVGWILFYPYIIKFLD
jgi:undecaprenol kinase